MGVLTTAAEGFHGKSELKQTTLSLSYHSHVLHLQARLRDKHQELLRKKLFFLKQQQLSQDGTGEGSPLFPGGTEEEVAEEQGMQVKVDNRAKAGPSGTGEEADTLIDEDDLLKHAYEDYESGGYSPKLIKFADVEEVQDGCV